MTFGEKVRTARIERDLSQKELARRTGIAVRTIVNYETGARRPKRRESYVALAKSWTSTSTRSWMTTRPS